MMTSKPQFELDKVVFLICLNRAILMFGSHVQTGPLEQRSNITFSRREKRNEIYLISFPGLNYSPEMHISTLIVN